MWPGTATQRCLVHPLRNTFTDLTRNPKSEAGRELLAHIRKLPRIHGAGQAAAWMVGPDDWHTRHGGYICVWATWVPHCGH